MLLTAVLCVAPVSTLQAADAPFRLESTWKLGGYGSWDYMMVDARAHILYIARLNRVMLVDIQSGKLVTEITGLTHAHGIALDDRGGVGYISDGGAGKILVFDRATHQVTASVPAGKNPDSILFEPTQRRVFAFNGTSASPSNPKRRPAVLPDSFVVLVYAIAGGAAQHWTNTDRRAVLAPSQAVP
jgi:YVTN family beta-propeller protein